ncbi:hypothetical protein [Pseudobacteroides cellulosolvens]|uniref:Uncharacterized protein n=1 Tax=Pseudobacteroides cellulosolvens ATCC 35603 = DSM 2933 TaxID=398512 RepID=A0A0L6JME6_9FIRM|nr:hypothetical protein [Pseudobacteroides cellulosolvens]KNY26930.1 hypothetical protein Bccel_2195 [Pseudobacteroides cellulosolvens ATCC 35603 = DSM 2933]
MFITQVGNGGDGPPYYGMYSLDEACINTKEFNKNSNNFLREDFPLKEYWVWENETRWTDELKKKRKCVYYGNFILGTDGCAQYWTLIITGSQRGQVWMLADVGAQPCAPSLSFWDWYEYWLDGGSDWWREFKY